MQRSRGQLRGEPLSLVLPGRAINPVDALHFDQGPTRATSPLVNRLLSAGTPDRVDDDPQDRPTSGVPVPLADLRALVEQEAQRGCSAAAAGQVHDRVERAHTALRGVGLTVFTPPDPTLTPAETLLRSHYLLQQVERTLG